MAETEKPKTFAEGLNRAYDENAYQRGYETGYAAGYAKAKEEAEQNDDH